MEDSYGINKKEKNKKIGKRSVLRLQENLFSSNFFGNRSTQPRVDKVVFQANDQAMAHGGFEERDCSRYPIITRAWRVSTSSINRLCCGSSRGATTSLMIIYRRVIER